MSRSRWNRLLAVACGLGLSTVAFGLPWDTDMTDGTQKKAYSFDMGTLPDGVVAQPAVTSPKTFAHNYVRTAPEVDGLVNPLPGDDATLARGKAMYGIYCTPCHGNGEVLGVIAGSPPTRLPGVSVLAGPAGVLPTRSDGFVYLTIRNGGTVMPSYGWAMSDTEMWSVVTYLRTLKNAAYVPPTTPTSGGQP
ncbi:MAG: c-type cytochrome [Myxococcota bacterium]